MLSSKFRRVMVAVALAAVASVATAGGFRGHHQVDAMPVVSGDLGEVVVYAPGDLGEVVVYAPQDLPDVQVSATREPPDAPVLASATDGMAGLAQAAAPGF